MRIVGDATYDIVIDWLDDDCHPDVQLKRQLASITKIPFKCVKPVLFVPDETYWGRDIRELRKKWTRKSTFMAIHCRHRYVLKFYLDFEGDNFYFRFMLLGEHLVDENECTGSFCQFIHSFTCLKSWVKLVNNTELIAKLKQEWAPSHHRDYFYIANRERRTSFLRKHNVLHFTNKVCRLHEMDDRMEDEPYLRTHG
uniref:Uncharacterized protein n=2 Tax=Tetranychus urticae TaxID=32264 RepID=T1L382_TETUR